MSNVILIGGISYDSYGRPLGPYRLRTAAESAGYSLKVVDYAWAFDEQKLFSLLQKLISKETRVLGISAAWFDFFYDKSANQWATESFFSKVRAYYPDLIIVIGGTKLNAHSMLTGNANWFITGFSDIAFIKLLDYIFKNKSDGLIYTEKSNRLKTKIIDGDIHYTISNMDELETIFKKEDNFLEYQPVPLEVSRGCIFKCSFCTHPFLGKKSYDYIRSPGSLAKELARNYNLFGTYRYTISDDTFNDSYEKISIVEQAVKLANLPKFEFVGYIRPELLVTKTDMLSRLLSLGLKGCHLGVESMDNDARKLVGKGMDIDRILTVVENLRTNNVRVHASFIAGLPNETEKSVYQTNDFLIENRQKYFHSWSWNGLGLIKGAGANDSYSLFEKNPAAYGIETSIIENSMFLDWKNTLGITAAKATEMADNCNSKARPYQQFAGWSLAQAWYHALTEEQIQNETPQSLNMRAIAKKNGLGRAEKNYSQIINTSYT